MVYPCEESFAVDRNNDDVSLQTLLFGGAGGQRRTTMVCLISLTLER